MRSALLCGGLAGVISVFLAGTARSSSIGISFDTGYSGTSSLVSTDTAGAGSYAQVGWNNTSSTGNSPNDSAGTGVSSGTALESSFAGATPNVIYDSSGTPTSVGLSWQTAGAYNPGVTKNTSSTTADAKLMSGYYDNYNVMQSGNPTTTSTYSLKGLNSFMTANSASSYSIVVYMGAGTTNGSRTGGIQLGGTTYAYSIDSFGVTLPSGYNQATTTVTPTGNTTDFDGAPQANYAVFSGLTDDTQTINVLLGDGSGNAGAGLYGIQIIPATATPEPASLGIGAFCAVALLVRRRQRA